MKAVRHIDRVGWRDIGDIGQNGLETIPRTMQNAIRKGFHLDTPAALRLDKFGIRLRDRIDAAIHAA